MEVREQETSEPRSSYKGSKAKTVNGLWHGLPGKGPIGRTSDIMGDAMACSARTLGSSVLTQFGWYNIEMGSKCL